MNSQKYILSTFSSILDISDPKDGIREVSFKEFNTKAFVPEDFIVQFNDRDLDYYHMKDSFKMFDGSAKATFINKNGQILEIEDFGEGYPFDKKFWSNIDIIKKVIAGCETVSFSFDNGKLSYMDISFYYSDKADLMHPSCESWIISEDDNLLIYKAFTENKESGT